MEITWISGILVIHPSLHLSPPPPRKKGGKKVLLRVLGTDASKQFDQFHNKAILEQFHEKLHVGDIGNASAASAPAPVTPTPAQSPAAAPTPLDEPFGDLVPFGDPSWYSDWSSPYYNDSHRRLRAAVRAFVDKEITPNCFAWDEAKQIPKSLFLKAADAGILAGMCGYVCTKRVIGRRGDRSLTPLIVT